MPRKLSFIIGSGASLASCMPSTNAITQQILSGNGIMRHTDGCFYFAPPLYGMPDEYVPKLIAFLHILKAEVDLYYSANTNRVTNYEDIYYIASQIHDSESGEYDNPAIGPLAEKVRTIHRGVLHGRPWDKDSDWDLIEISEETTNYIRDTAWHILATPPKRIDQYDFLKACFEDNNFIKLDIFTLNHDTIIEQNLAHHCLPFIDGFDSPANNLRPWKPELYDSSGERDIRLFKLHGSVNWFRFDHLQHPSIAIASGDIWHTKDATGKYNWPSEGRPEMLLGTFNKMLSYSKAGYSQLHNHFHTSVHSSHCLIVSGFSFNDKAINSTIIDWASSSEPRKMVIIHPNPDALKRTARPAISRQLDEWIAKGLVSIIPKRIEESNWDEIQKHL
jgi:hypothetical protein